MGQALSDDVSGQMQRGGASASNSQPSQQQQQQQHKPQPDTPNPHRSLAAATEKWKERLARVQGSGLSS